MKKFMGIIYMIGIYFIIYFLQVNFFNCFTIFGVKPNLFILHVFFIGMFAGQNYGLFVGAALGILSDTFFSGGTGITGIIWGAAGFFSGFFSKKVSTENKMTMIIVGNIITITCEVLIYCYQIIVNSSSIEIFTFIKFIFLEALYNTLLIIIFYKFIQLWGRWIEQVFKKQNTLPKYF